MKYKVGDKVKIKSKEWYENGKDEDGVVLATRSVFIKDMSRYCGMDAIIEAAADGRYLLDIDSMEWHWCDGMFEGQDVECMGNECEKEEQGHIITLPSPNDPQVLLNQISILTQTLSVLCATGHANSASIVEEKIMKLIEKL